MSQVIVITGGARGIGLGIAKALLTEDCQLLLNGVRPAAEVQPVLEELRQTGRRVEYVSANVGTAAGRREIIDAALTHFGRIDSLVNNAGITSPGRKDILFDADEETFDHVLEINLKGPFFLTQLAAQQMVKQRAAEPGFRGSVIFVSSISADFVSTNRGDYCLTKSALGMATKLWAVRLAEFGIDVYEIRPGVIRSDMTAGVTEKYDKLISEGLTLDRRWGEPEDVGKAARALIFRDIPYATGQVLRIDGGMTIRAM
jgi:NAD(P)-dependent dehydrogenase (short-subunit alcohol dehydrogenase family)